MVCGKSDSQTRWVQKLPPCTTNLAVNGGMVITRALTNTVGGEYECIHDYRVTNTNANIRRMVANDLKTRAPFYLIRTGTVPKFNRYQPV